MELCEVVWDATLLTVALVKASVTEARTDNFVQVSLKIWNLCGKTKTFSDQVFLIYVRGRTCDHDVAFFMMPER